MKQGIINKRKGVINTVMNYVNTLPKEYQQELNELAKWEFIKPKKYRFTSKQLLDKVINDVVAENEKTIGSFG